MIAREVVAPVDVSYPVIVEYTMRHVVWVEARDQASAVQWVDSAPYEHTSDSETLYEAGWEAKAPQGDWDWRDVEERSYSGPYQGTGADAHVEAHRDHLRRVELAHVAALVEEEDREVAAGSLAEADRRTCAVCKQLRGDGHDESAYHRSGVLWAQREAERAGGAS